MEKPQSGLKKTSLRLRKPSVRVQFTYYRNTHTLQNPTNTHITKPTLAHTHTHTHTHFIYNVGTASNFRTPGTQQYPKSGAPQ